MPKPTRLHWGIFLVATGAAVLHYCAALAREQTPNLGNLLVHVVTPINSEKILPDTFPLPGKRSTTISLQACRGEYEPASFVVRTGAEGVTGLLPVVTDLISATGNRIPKENIDIKLVKIWYQSGGAWEKVQKIDKLGPVLVPELLINDPDLVRVDMPGKTNSLKLTAPNGSIRYQDISSPNSGIHKDVPVSVLDMPIKDSERLLPTELPRDTTQQYWLTILAPKDAPSDIYHGSIHLTSKGGAIGNLNIQVHVHPFELAKPSLEYSIYYRGFISPDGQPSISSEEKSRSQLRRELIDMREHGISNPTVLQRYFGKNDHKLQLLKDYLEIRKQLGFEYLPLYYLGRPTYNPTEKEKLEDLSSNVREIIQESTRTKNTEVYVYGLDEAKDDKLLSQKPAWAAVHSVGGKIFTSGYAGHFEKMGKETDLLIYYGPPSREEAAKVHSVGNRIFSYANPQGGVENPFIYRKNFGIVLWRSGFDGAMTYAYQDTDGFIWNDFDQASPYRDHVFAYPTREGVIDTIAWEGFREAVDDVRYISTLQQRLREPDASEKPGFKSEDLS